MDTVVIERLRQSRFVFDKNLEELGALAGRKWLNEEASYFQIKSIEMALERQSANRLASMANVNRCLFDDAEAKEAEGFWPRVTAGCPDCKYHSDGSFFVPSEFF